MQEILGFTRRAVQEYDMIQQGDRIAVGVSGGKDSVVLLAALAQLRRFLGIDYEVVALTADLRVNNTEGDFSPIQKLCDELGVEYVVRRTDLWDIIFNVRKETNPCSLCSRMKRGLLHDMVKSTGCNKLALGHHADDAIETFMMNLFNEGRIGCFSPVTYLSRKDITLIRPLVLAGERDISRAARRANLPIIASGCPADGKTNRQWTKEWLEEMEKTHPGIKKRIFGAMKRAHVSEW